MGIEWYVKEQSGNTLLVMYTMDGVERKTTLTIPGADGKITEELVRIAIDNEVKIAVRRHRFIGMKGAVTVPEIGGSHSGESS